MPKSIILIAIFDLPGQNAAYHVQPSAQVAIPDQEPVPPHYQPAPLPPPEEPPLPLRKVRSTQDLFITTIDKPCPPCPICDLRKTTGKHTYMGNYEVMLGNSTAGEDHNHR